MIKLSKNKNKIYNNLVLLVGIGCIGVFLMLWGFLFFLIQPDNYADWLVAIGTLMLAFFTFYSILSSREVERKYRQYQLDKEDRQRKERILNEIINWVEMISVFRINPGKDVSFPQNSKSVAYTMQNAEKFKDDLLKISSRCTYIKSVVSYFDSKKLTDLTNELISNINSDLSLSGQVTQLLNEWYHNYDGLNKGDMYLKYDSLVTNMLIIGVSLDKIIPQIIEEATNIKIRLYIIPVTSPS